MSTYPSIEAYTADVKKAVRAYESDQAVATEFCANLDGRKKRPGYFRRCNPCYVAKRGESA